MEQFQVLVLSPLAFPDALMEKCMENEIAYYNNMGANGGREKWGEKGERGIFIYKTIL